MWEWQVVKRKFNINGPNDLIDLGPQIIVTTLGDKGAEIFYRSNVKPEQFIIAPSLVDNPETTGAGNAFSLGFLFGYIQNLPLDICGKMGSRLASYAVKRNGVIIQGASLGQFRQEFNT